MSDVKTLKWRVHFVNLIAELMNFNEGLAIFVQPMHILKSMLGEIASTASRQQNYEIMAICGRLALYEECDPTAVGDQAGQNIEMLEARALRCREPEDLRGVPADYASPDWDVPCGEFDWKAMVPDDMKEIWPTFNNAQRAVVSRHMRETADSCAEFVGVAR